jgi:hypothetical protein
MVWITRRGKSGLSIEESNEAIAEKIANLKERIREYRRLAAEYRAAPNLPVADKLREVAAECEATVAELERILAKPRK